MYNCCNRHLWCMRLMYQVSAMQQRRKYLNYEHLSLKMNDLHNFYMAKTWKDGLSKWDPPLSMNWNLLARTKQAPQQERPNEVGLGSSIVDYRQHCIGLVNTTIQQQSCKQLILHVRTQENVCTPGKQAFCCCKIHSTERFLKLKTKKKNPWLMARKSIFLNVMKYAKCVHSKSSLA